MKILSFEHTVGWLECVKVLGNFQCQGLLIWIIEGQGPTVLAVGVVGGLLGYFFSFFPFLFFYLPLSGRRPKID